MFQENSALSETSPHAIQHTQRAQFQYYYSSSYDHRDQGLDPMGKGTGGSGCLQYPTLPYSESTAPATSWYFHLLQYQALPVKKLGVTCKKECGSSNKKPNLHRMWFWWEHMDSSGRRPAQILRDYRKVEWQLQVLCWPVLSKSLHFALACSWRSHGHKKPQPLETCCTDPLGGSQVTSLENLPGPEACISITVMYSSLTRKFSFSHPGIILCHN